MNNVKRMTMITPIIMMKLNNSNHTPLVKYEYYTISFQESITSTYTFLLNICLTMFNPFITNVNYQSKSETLRLPPYVFMPPSVASTLCPRQATSWAKRPPNGKLARGSHVFWGSLEISTKFKIKRFIFW